MGFGETYTLELTLLGMGAVFFCLTLLYGFFAATGRISVRWGHRLLRKSAAPAAEPEAEVEEEEVPEEVVAVIGLALAQARRHLAVGTAGDRVLGPGSSWREQGRWVQHQRSRHWGTR